MTRTEAKKFKRYLNHDKKAIKKLYRRLQIIKAIKAIFRRRKK